ncbi:hypothetical protein [Halorubrum trueperi]|uniref:DUF8080 domain-containing protein n=1 Tax=Halorubrum trueperi TaxID=2004704 RepID=A0ABD5ULE6_9EURY
MDLTWTVDREGDASLVRCCVRNDEAVPRRVRIENRLDGPVLPPRRAGVPEPGWDATGVTMQLAPGDRRALGFAVPAPPEEPPVELREATAAEVESAETRSPASAALRTLGDHRPPRATVTDEETKRREGTASTDAGVRADEGDADGVDIETDGKPDPGPSMSGIDEWFAAVERRLERAERLTDTDLATATDVVAESGGIDGIDALDERIAADAERLREVSERAAALATRAEATDAPMEALERLA